MNTDFASYVREASFNLTLSSEMIGGLLELDRDITFNSYNTETKDRKRDCGVIYGRRTSTALYRRGLVLPTARKDFPADWLESVAWPYYYELTEAGRLIVALLKEAGFKASLLPSCIDSGETVPEPAVTLKK